MVSRNLPFEYFVLNDVRPDGPVIGYVGQRPLSAVVVDANGCRYRFRGLACRDAAGRLDVRGLSAGEWIVAPDLVYSASGA
jgi:hypothetical protein